MDPATASAAAAAASEVYKIGGYALLFFFVLVAGATAVFIVIFRMYIKLGDRLTAIEDRSNKQAMTVIADNTASNMQVTNAVVSLEKTTKESSAQIVTALRERPCLIDPPPPRPHQTPLPFGKQTA